jgi:type IV secretion system protein VirD4
MSTATITLLIASVATLGVSVLAWRRQERLVAVVFGAVTGLLAYDVSAFLAVGVLLCAATTLWNRRAQGASLVQRWSAGSRRRHGVASSFQILRRASGLAVRRKATTVRPSLRELSWWVRVRARTTELALLLCRVGALRVWASVEDVVLVFGAPRKGKTGWFVGRVLDAPGAVIATSTKTDLYDVTHALRAAKGPVSVFAPTGHADLPSTITFDPLTGCASPTTAAERATDLIAGGSTGRGTNSGDVERWEGQARRVLTALLHAAALGGCSMHTVLAWVANPDTASRHVMSLLRRSPSAAAYVPDAEQFLTTNDRTRSSITSTIMPCLGWLSNPAACAATTGTAPFDVAQLLRAKATVYLLGAKELNVAPLLSALTGHIAREATRIAARSPQGRLDPPLTLALDEAANICPVPLAEWTSHMGGQGLQIVAAFQSKAQMENTWGPTAARVILGNAGAILCFRLGADTDDLTHWSALAGTRQERIAHHDTRGQISSYSTHTVPVISPAQLANLPMGRVVLFHHELPPALGRVRPGWKRADVRVQRLRAWWDTRSLARALRDPVTAAQSAHPRRPTLREAARRVTHRYHQSIRRAGPLPPAASNAAHAPPALRLVPPASPNGTRPTAGGDTPQDVTGDTH